MSELIAPGTTQTDFSSGEFTVTAGTPKTIFLKAASLDAPAPSGVDFELAHKTSGGKYTTFAVINAGNFAQIGQVTSAGTFALRRLASAVSAGADVE